MNRKDEDIALCVLKTIHDLLIQRRYSEDDELTSYSQMSLIEFKEIYEQSLSNGLSFGPINHSVNSNDKIVIKLIFNTTRKANIKEVCESYMKEYGNDIRILIVIKDKITPNIIKEINLEKYKHVDLFHMKQLVINITKHELQPKFEIILPNEEESILKQFVPSSKNSSVILSQFKSKLPKIIRDDPIARFYGLRPGSILKITRMNEHSGRYVTFRCCA